MFVFEPPLVNHSLKSVNPGSSPYSGLTLPVDYLDQEFSLRTFKLV